MYPLQSWKIANCWCAVSQKQAANLESILHYLLLATTKNGISSTELSRKLALRQKTCWLFNRTDDAAESNEGKNRAAGRKIMVVAVERKGKGVPRMYGRVIEMADKKNLNKFISDSIHKDALLRTDGWTGYRGLEVEFPNLGREKSEKKGKIFPVASQQNDVQGLAKRYPPCCSPFAVVYK